MRFFITYFFIFVLLSGCTANQQDALLDKLVEYGRSNAGLELKFARLPDSEIAYLERQGTGPTVVLVHGFSANKDTWLKLVPELPADWHIIAPDLAGHGESQEIPQADFLLTTQAERLYAVLQQLNIQKVHMVGNSMGGAITMIYAAMYPQATSSIVLMDSAGMTAPQPSEYMQALARGENPLIATDEESFNYRWNFVMSQRPPLFWPLKPAMIRKTLARVEVNQRIFEDMLNTQKLLDEDFEQQLAQVSIPVLILWGEEDRVLDKSAIGEFKKFLPQAKAIVYPDVGHVPMIEIPKQTAKDIAEFIQ